MIHNQVLSVYVRKHTCSELIEADLKTLTLLSSSAVDYSLLHRATEVKSTAFIENGSLSHGCCKLTPVGVLGTVIVVWEFSGT